jgi:multiple sugar transport system permease protein
VTVANRKRPAGAPTVHRPRLPGGPDGRAAFWLVGPALLVLAAIIGYPVVKAAARSLYGDGIDAHQPFVGLHNYAAALWGTSSSTFWASVEVTFLFTVVTVLLETLIGLGMALVMNRAFWGRGLLRASVLVPWAIPTAVTAVLWK